MIETCNSRIQLSLNGSYDKTSSACSKTIRLVNRIRRLSPANWRRRSHSSTGRNQSYNSLVETSSFNSENSSADHIVGKNSSQITDRISRPMISNRKTIKRYHSSTSIGDFKNSLQTQKSSNHYSIRELYDLVEPDINVWDLKRRFPTTFINLITSYIRSIELSSSEMATLYNHVVTSNDDSVIQSIFKSKSQKVRKNASNSISNIFTWTRVINTLINYLITDERYAVKFILRKPGNQVSINELEQTLLRLIDIHPNPNSLPNLTEILKRHDVHVISCVLTRLLRKNGPLFSQVLSNIFLQISNSVAYQTELNDDSIREQKKSIRLLMLLHSETMRDEILKPLCILLQKIANEKMCEVDGKSLSVLFSPILFIDQNNSKPSDINNPEFLRAVELLMCILSSNSIDHLFHVPKLFILDSAQNLKLNIEAVKRNEKDMPPLYCSLRYCMPISPSPNKSQKKSKVQRNNAFSHHRTSPISQKLIQNQHSSQVRMGRTEKKRTLEDETVQFRESLLAPMLKKPIVMTLSNNNTINPVGQNQPKVIKCEKSNDHTIPFVPLIRNTLLDTQLNFRIRRRPSQQKVASTMSSVSGTFNSSNSSLNNTSSSISGIFDCIKGNKENEMKLTP